MHFNILYSFTFFILFSLINIHFNSVLLLFVCLFANTPIVFKHLNTYLILIDIDFGTHSLYPDLFSLCFLACTFHVVSFGWPFLLFLLPREINLENPSALLSFLCKIWPINHHVFSQYCSYVFMMFLCKFFVGQFCWLIYAQDHQETSITLQHACF